MRRIVDYFRGCVRLRLRGCEPERCLQCLLRAGVAFWNTQKSDEFTLLLTLRRADAARAERIAQLCQCDAEFTALRSFRGDFSGLKKRRALLLGMLLVIAGAILAPNVILSVEVSGCETLEPERIVRALDDLGVHFGTWGPSIDSEQLRNEMLRRITELRWIGVNWSGMRAKVQVSEHALEKAPLELRGCADLTACADGVITGVEVYNGQAMVQPGDAVHEGQVLISGLVDLERCWRATRALGEVYAETRREWTVLTPAQRSIRTPERLAGVCVWLRVGRKRIKIFGNSGISMGDCVKMINRRSMRLPLDLCVERCYRTAPQRTELTQPQASALLRESAKRRTAEALVAGTVLSEDDALTDENGVWRLTTVLHCREMIARSAEIPILELEQHGTNDQRGTNGAAD